MAQQYTGGHAVPSLAAQRAKAATVQSGVVGQTGGRQTAEQLSRLAMLDTMDAVARPVITPAARRAKQYTREYVRWMARGIVEATRRRRAAAARQRQQERTGSAPPNSDSLLRAAFDKVGVPVLWERFRDECLARAEASYRRWWCANAPTITAKSSKSRITADSYTPAEPEEDDPSPVAFLAAGFHKQWVSALYLQPRDGRLNPESLTQQCRRATALCRAFTLASALPPFLRTRRERQRPPPPEDSVSMSEWLFSVDGAERALTASRAALASYRRRAVAGAASVARARELRREVASGALSSFVALGRHLARVEAAIRRHPLHAMQADATTQEERDMAEQRLKKHKELSKDPAPLQDALDALEKHVLRVRAHQRGSPSPPATGAESGTGAAGPGGAAAGSGDVATGSEAKQEAPAGGEDQDKEEADAPMSGLPAADLERIAAQVRAFLLEDLPNLTEAARQAMGRITSKSGQQGRLAAQGSMAAEQLLAIALDTDNAPAVGPKGRVAVAEPADAQAWLSLLAEQRLRRAATPSGQAGNPPAQWTSRMQRELSLLRACPESAAAAVARVYAQEAETAEQRGVMSSGELDHVRMRIEREARAAKMQQHRMINMQRGLANGDVKLAQQLRASRK